MLAYKKILICPECGKQLDDSKILDNYIENGIHIECNKCNDGTELVPGLIVAGHEGVNECEMILDEMNNSMM